jgi:hypothetical protein
MVIKKIVGLRILAYSVSFSLKMLKTLIGQRVWSYPVFTRPGHAQGLIMPGTTYNNFIRLDFGEKKVDRRILQRFKWFNSCLLYKQLPKVA